MAECHHTGSAMNSRVLLAIGCAIFLVGLAGCTSFGDVTSEAALLEERTYDWETEADATIDLGGSEYEAVFTIENRSAIRIASQTRYGTEDPIAIRSVQFRYPNDTVVNATEIGVSETRSAVTLDLPAENGQLAYTASKRSKQFSTPVLVEGSWEVIVPEGHRVDNMILSTVRPGGYDTEVVNDRVHITWASVTSSSITVEYYLARDLYLFAGLIVVAVIAGSIGIAYVYRQIQELRRQREEMGLDVDVDDEFGKRPPPGMG